jgi:hypothetical protein
MPPGRFGADFVLLLVSAQGARTQKAGKWCKVVNAGHNRMAGEWGNL